MIYHIGKQTICESTAMALGQGASNILLVRNGTHRALPQDSDERRAASSAMRREELQPITEVDTSSKLDPDNAAYCAKVLLTLHFPPLGLSFPELLPLFSKDENLPSLIVSA